MTTWELNQNNLTKFLRDSNLEPLFEKSSSLTYINILVNDHELPVFFVIRSEGEVLQLVCYFPYQLSETHKEATARLLHLLNRDIDIPGFGMDEEQGLIFYRLVIPCLNKEMSGPLLRIYIDTIKIVCDSFVHAIGLISTGNLNLDEMKRLAREKAAES
ncbi:YbjN domain-containing protein [Chlamydia sp. 17-3921]|uniref:YbjN domain-containing protein n=1 Tax=Chlamydia sp. 17-3921 TaxID=2675798 RepID=UPI00191AB394|nr:YbjN domain-containing protein [Chlamydia sp. 17-3921]